MHLATACLLLIVQIIYAKQRFELSKCCEENYHLDFDAISCVPSPHLTLSQNSTKTLAETIFDISGTPYERRSDIAIVFNTLSQVKKFEITKTFRVNFEFNNKSSEAQYFLGNDLLDEKRSCFDIFIKNNQTLVGMVASVALKAIHKCCKKGDRLSVDADHCEHIPGKNESDIAQVIIDPTSNNEDYNWIPEKLSRSFLKVKYNFMENYNKYKWNWKAKENGLSWQFLRTQSGFPALIAVEDRDASRNVTKSATEFFCFDEVSEGLLAPRVLLAAGYSVHKCCGKGMQLSNDLSKCLPRPGVHPKAGMNVDEINWWKNPDDAFWLPNKLRGLSLYVRYWDRYPAIAGFIYDENLWTLEQDHGVPTVKLYLTLLSGKTFIFRTSEFCFEFVADAMRVLAVKKHFLKELPQKCCYPGEIISPNGYCIKHNGSDWTPGSSEARSHFQPRTTPVANIKFPMKVTCQRFSTRSINTSRSIEHFGGKHMDKGKWRNVHYCSDLQMTGDGVREVVGSCEDTPTADYYATIRPMGMVSAILFAGAGLMAVAQTETRRSAHGRALACHALSFSVTNALQMAWFFTTSGRADFNCHRYSYPVYFFMTAANFWLTSISVNMVHGFRQPLGAMANAGTSGGVWKRFAIMSFFSWGGSVILTGVAITMHMHEEQLADLGFIIPSFFETRTCAFENFFFFSNADFRDAVLGGRIGALCYYYTPTALLVVTNGVCVFLTGRTIHSLQRDKEFLQRDAAYPHGSLAQQTLRNALLYTKLLFTAGIIEILIEAMGWAFGGQRRPSDIEKSWIDAVERAYMFGITTTFLDLVRSITVFWLCTGGQCCCKEIARKMSDYLFTKWNGLRRRFHRNNADIELRHDR